MVTGSRGSRRVIWEFLGLSRVGYAVTRVTWFCRDLRGRNRGVVTLRKVRTNFPSNLSNLWKIGRYLASNLPSNLHENLVTLCGSTRPRASSAQSFYCDPTHRLSPSGEATL